MTDIRRDTLLALGQKLDDLGFPGDRETIEEYVASEGTGWRSDDEFLAAMARDVWDFHFRHVGDEENRPVYEQAAAAIQGARVAFASAALMSRAEFLHLPAEAQIGETLPSNFSRFDGLPDWKEVEPYLRKMGWEREDEFVMLGTDYEREEEVDLEQAWDASRDRFSDFYYEVQDRLRKSTAEQAPLTIYRRITAPDRKGIDTDCLGVFWSWDENAAEAHWGQFGGGSKEWLLVGEVDPKHVNWLGSAYANVRIPDEKEILLQDDAPVRLIGVTGPDGKKIRAKNARACEPRQHRAERLPVGTKSPRQEAMERFWGAFEKIVGEGQLLFVGPFQLVGDRKGGILAKLEVSGSIEEVGGKPAVHIGYIGVSSEDRKKGYGAHVMQMLVDAADSVEGGGLGMDLDVAPQKEYGDKKPPMNAKQLGEFYGKFGFKKIKGGGAKYMQRPARAQVEKLQANVPERARNVEVTAQVFMDPEDMLTLDDDVDVGEEVAILSVFANGTVHVGNMYLIWAGNLNENADCARGLNDLRKRYPGQIRGAVAVSLVERMPENVQGTGIGVELYIAAAHFAKAQFRAALVPHDCVDYGQTSAEAKRVWNSRRFRAAVAASGPVAYWTGGESALVGKVTVERLPAKKRVPVYDEAAWENFAQHSEANQESRQTLAQRMEAVAWETGYEHASTRGQYAPYSKLAPFEPLAKAQGVDLRAEFDAGFEAFGGSTERLPARKPVKRPTFTCAEGPFGYHGTQKKHLAKIKIEGLQTSLPSQVEDADQPEGVYFAITPDRSSGGVVLRFPWPEDAEEDQYGDTVLLCGEAIHAWWYTPSWVPPDQIEVFEPKKGKWVLLVPSKTERLPSDSTKLDRLIEIVDALTEKHYDNPHLDWKKLLNKHKEFEHVGGGGGRTVFRLDKNRVAKVAASGGGVVQNQIEHALWESTKRGWGAEVLVPVEGLYGRTGEILVMEYAKPLSKTAKTWNEIQHVQQIIHDNADEYPHDADFEFNYGRHDGKVKLLDYGSGPAPENDFDGLEDYE